MGLWDRNLLLPDFSKRVQQSSRTGDFSAAKQWYSEPTSSNRTRHTAPACLPLRACSVSLWRQAAPKPLGPA